MSVLVWPRPKGERVREGGREGGREGERVGGPVFFRGTTKSSRGLWVIFSRLRFYGTECSFVSGLCFSLDVCALKEPDGQLKAFTAGHGHRE